LVTALETWVFGAILALMGFLVTACGLAQNALGIPFVISGLTSASVGSVVFGYKFKQWIEHL
jgi:hypothetical protein